MILTTRLLFTTTLYSWVIHVGLFRHLPQDVDVGKENSIHGLSRISYFKGLV